MTIHVLQGFERGTTMPESLSSLTERRAAAAREWNEHEKSGDGEQLVNSLDRGLTLLADLLYVRLHKDVEATQGKDSMLTPVSPHKTQSLAMREIGLYQIAESVVFARLANYVRDDGSWYMDWLGRLRFVEPSPQPQEMARIMHDLSQTADQRRLAFSDLLARVVPESRWAPLVLFLLTPLATHAATALAFGDSQRAGEVRRQQAVHLPAIDGCSQCRRQLLPNGELCPRCGNPLWSYEWLTSSD
jgi:hypothetical protein